MFFMRGRNGYTKVVSLLVVCSLLLPASVLVAADGDPVLREDGEPVLEKNAPMTEIVSGYVMDTWGGDPALEREQVRDAAVGLIEGQI